MRETAQNTISFGAWSLDVHRELLYIDGTVARVQPGVLRLLIYLAQREGRVASKAELIDAIWDGREISDAAIYNRVSALREAIRDEDGPDRCIQWEYGRGLRFARPTRASADTVMDPDALAALLGGNTNDPGLGPASWFDGTAEASEWRHLLGIYHLHYQTPSWPDAIKVGVSVLTEVDGTIVVQTTEQGQDATNGIRQRARYRGRAEFIDGRIYVFEQNRKPPRSVCLTVLDAPHAYSPDAMTGMMMGSSWRLKGAPYATRVVWRRLPADVTLREAIRQSGPYANGVGLDEAIVTRIGRHCLTFERSENSVQPDLVRPPVTRRAATGPTASSVPGSRSRTGPGIVAVLPFQTMADDVSLRHLSYGVSTDIRAQLSKFRDVRIASTGTAPSSADDAEGLSPKDQAAQWGADYLLHGSVRPLGRQLRITSHLIDAATETQIWANSYELSALQLSETQDKVTHAITTSVVSMLTQYQLAQANLRDLDSLTPWECYLRGCAIMHTFDPKAQSDAIALFQRGIDLDREYADLFAVLSYSMNTQYKLPKNFLHSNASESRYTPQRMQAHQIAKQAVELDPRVPFVWVALGRSHLGLGEIVDAIAAAERALELNPNLGWAHFLLGYCYWPLNRGEEALRAFDLAFEALGQDSFRWIVIEGKACALMVLGRYDEAIETANRAQIEPRAGHFAHCAEICSLARLGRQEEAASALQRALEKDPYFGLTMIEHDQPLPYPTVRELIADGFAFASRANLR